MTNLRELAKAAKAADANPDLGAFKDAYRHFQTAATPAAISALYAELDEALAYDVRKMSAPDIAVQLPGSEHDRLQRICQRAFDAYKQGKEMEVMRASLSEKEREVERLRALLPAAEGILTWCEERPKEHAYDTFMALKAAVAKAKEHTTLTQEPTNAD